MTHDHSRFVIQEVLDENQHRSKLVSKSTVDSISRSLYGACRSYQAYQTVVEERTDVLDMSWFDARNNKRFVEAIGHCMFLINILTLRGHRNVLFMHSFNDAKPDLENWAINYPWTAYPNNFNMLFAPVVAQALGIDDIYWYMSFVNPYEEDYDWNLANGMFSTKLRQENLRVTQTQYQLGGELNLQQPSWATIDEDVVFDCVFMYGIDKQEMSKKYSSDSIKEVFAPYCKENFELIDYYESQLYKDFSAMREVDLIEEARWLNTSEDISEHIEIAIRLASQSIDELERKDGDSWPGGETEHKLFLRTVVDSWMKKIFKVF